jgi:hypothetical protein
MRKPDTSKPYIEWNSQGTSGKCFAREEEYVAFVLLISRGFFAGFDVHFEERQRRGGEIQKYDFTTTTLTLAGARRSAERIFSAHYKITHA